MAAKVWSKVAIAVQSALATALVITSITKATPAVVAYTGTDPVNADYALLKVSGMSQMNYRVVRVANVNGVGNTFEAEGIDSTLFDTFVSGTAEIITFGTSLGVVATLQAGGGDFKQIDITTIHDDTDRSIPGNANTSTFDFTCLWDPGDAGLVALKAASDAKAIRCVRFTFADGAKHLISAYVGTQLAPTGAAQGRVETPVVLTVYGPHTSYAI